MQGRIINLNGGKYQVVLEDNTIVTIPARGKFRSIKKVQANPNSLSKKETVMTVKNSPKVGDLVTVLDHRIDSILERKNELIRPDISNVDQILLVFAAKEPDFSSYLLDLFIVNIAKHNIHPVIVITKIDKLNEDEFTQLKQQLSYYEKLGYDVLYVNSKSGEGVTEVAKLLESKVTVLSGQTGAGKSTLINAIFPDFELKTQEISQALGRGKHTTRETTLYAYKNGYIGDTPGFSKLDVLGIEKKELSNLFVEFSEETCRFKDCLHQKNAKDCGVHNAVLEGRILPSRHENYLKMLMQIEKGERR
ncbi:MAG: ribosome small subunit-dependent GTPase A [Anaeroplasmataceae bacterium]|nr:ribosome small subunit-dependent GTPase A [Anaeroplasmataceae bacterium]MDE6414844.1 ribosome small subunit-dependent GTPase A [Anaeroplasmataceae bacterium]